MRSTVTIKPEEVSTVNTQLIPKERDESKAGKRKSTRDPWYKRYPDDYRRGTRLLSLAARGAYSDLLDLIFIEGTGLPNDDRWIACSLHVKERQWKAARKELFAAGKLYIGDDGLIRNKRADEELAERDAIRKARGSRNPERGVLGSSPPRRRSVDESSRDRREREIDDFANEINEGGGASGNEKALYTHGRECAKTTDTDTEPERKRGLSKVDGSSLEGDDPPPDDGPANAQRVVPLRRRAAA